MNFAQLINFEAEAIERKDKLITIILAKVNGHRAKAAALLGISLRTLHRRIAVRVSKDSLLIEKEIR